MNSLLWANNMTEKSILTIGKTLVVPPVSGVIYHVQNGDAISKIAQTYKADIDDIIAFNDLTSEGDIFLGDILMIPNGTMPASISTYYASESIPLASGYFICPIAAPYRITQGSVTEFAENQFTQLRVELSKELEQQHQPLLPVTEIT